MPCWGGKKGPTGFIYSFNIVPQTTGFPSVGRPDTPCTDPPFAPPESLKYAAGPFRGYPKDRVPQTCPDRLRVCTQRRPRPPNVCFLRSQVKAFDRLELSQDICLLQTSKNIFVLPPMLCATSSYVCLCSVYNIHVQASFMGLLQFYPKRPWKHPNF